MATDLLLNKAAIIERCLQRIAEDYRGAEERLGEDLRWQDAIVLNLQRACQAAIDGAMHLVRVSALGLPQDSRDAFTLLERAGKLDPGLADALRAMVGFRNVAVHEYQRLSLPILRHILDHRLSDLQAAARLLVERA